MDIEQVLFGTRDIFRVTNLSTWYITDKGYRPRHWARCCGFKVPWLRVPLLLWSVGIDTLGTTIQYPGGGEGWSFCRGEIIYFNRARRHAENFTFYYMFIKSTSWSKLCISRRVRPKLFITNKHQPPPPGNRMVAPLGMLGGAGYVRPIQPVTSPQRGHRHTVIPVHILIVQIYKTFLHRTDNHDITVIL